MALGGESPVSALEMAVVEVNAVALGVGVDTMMENAGRAVAEEAVRHLPPAPARVAVLVGNGNNGGDGSAAAHYLAQWGYLPELYLAHPAATIRSAAARRCFDRAARTCPVHSEPPTATELGGYALLIDALLGTGQTGPLRAPYRDLAAVARESGVPVLAVDLPTGLGDATGLPARWSVALELPKTGAPSSALGELVVRPIGVPPEARERTGPGEFLWYPGPRADDRPRPGRVVVIGGGPFTGAPALAALAALRAGAERATVLAPLPAAGRIQTMSPDLVVRPIGEDHFRAADVPTVAEVLATSTVDAVVVGMGVGRLDATLDAMRTLLPELLAKYPVVVDADALDALPATLEGMGARRLLATPNATEYRRVFGGEKLGTVEAQADDAQRRAGVRHLTLLVKGDPDLIADGRRCVRNAHHPAALAVSGAGDVLAGVAGGLLARGVDPFGAARLAAYWVGEAGYRAEARHGPGLLATDVLDELGPALLDGRRRVAPDAAFGDRSAERRGAA